MATDRRWPVVADVPADELAAAVERAVQGLRWWRVASRGVTADLALVFGGPTWTLMIATPVLVDFVELGPARSVALLRAVPPSFAWADPMRTYGRILHDLAITIADDLSPGGPGKRSVFSARRQMIGLLVTSLLALVGVFGFRLADDPVWWLWTLPFGLWVVLSASWRPPLPPPMPPELDPEGAAWRHGVARRPPDQGFAEPNR